MDGIEIAYLVLVLVTFAAFATTLAIQSARIGRRR